MEQNNTIAQVRKISKENKLRIDFNGVIYLGKLISELTNDEIKMEVKKRRLFKIFQGEVSIKQPNGKKFVFDTEKVELFREYGDVFREKIIDIKHEGSISDSLRSVILASYYTPPKPVVQVAKPVVAVRKPAVVFKGSQLNNLQNANKATAKIAFNPSALGK